jgi:hypothetical protein
VPPELGTQVTRNGRQVLVNIAGVTGFSSPGSIPISTITGDPVADVARAVVAAGKDVVDAYGAEADIDSA